MAQAISEMGDWFYSLAIYNLLLELTGRAEAVALAVILQVLPQSLIGPTAGVVNDRLSRKQVMIVADLARVVIVLCMLFARTPSTVWIVYPLLFLESLMASFFEPARSAVIPERRARGRDDHRQHALGDHLVRSTSRWMRCSAGSSRRGSGVTPSSF